MARRTHRLLASALLGATLATATVTTAAAATPVSSRSLVDAVGDVEARNGAPTPAPAAADIVKAEVVHGTSQITVRAWMAGGPAPTAQVRDHDSSFVDWRLDVDGDAESDLSVIANVRQGALNGEIWLDGPGETPVCTGTTTYDEATHRLQVTFPRTCIGSPEAIRFKAYVRHALDLTRFYYDIAGSTTTIVPHSEPIHRARIATSLSSSVSASTVTHGQAATVSGTLTRTANGKAVAGQKVTLQRKYEGGSYTNVTTATTSSTGKVSFSINPSKNATYRLRHTYAGASGPGFDTIASPGRTIKVAPKVTLTASATTVTAGTTVNLTTKVAPKHAGTEVKLQKRRADGTWATVQTAKLNSESARTFKITASKTTIGTYRVVIPKHHDHTTGTSPTRTIKLG